LVKFVLFNTGKVVPQFNTLVQREPQTQDHKL